MYNIRKKIVVCGYNYLGEMVVDNLINENFEVIIFDDNHNNIKRAFEKRLRASIVDFVEDDYLIDVGISKNIDAMFCLLENDNTNLYIILSARNLSQKIYIATINNSDSSKEKLHLAGANDVFNPYELGSKRVFELLKKPHVEYFLSNILLKTNLELGQNDISLVEIIVPKSSIIANKHLSEIELSKNYNLILIAIIDREIDDSISFYTNTKNHKIDAGDELILLGKKYDIERFKRLLSK
jgi:voltage-gated potassium channel